MGEWDDWSCEQMFDPAMLAPSTGGASHARWMFMDNLRTSTP